MSRWLTNDEAAEAWAMLKHLCVRVHSTNSTSYRMVADKYGVTPAELKIRILDYNKIKKRDYMRHYMRKRRGSLKQG